MPQKRQRVRCWFCGKRARRVPSTSGLDQYQLTSDGRVGVVGRKRTLQPYGVCDGDVGWAGLCHQPMLLPKDALFALRAAREYDRAGGNKRSEYD